MSEYSRVSRGDPDQLVEILDPKWVLRHRGSPQKFVASYRRLAAEAAANKLAGLRGIAPWAVRYISDERTLFAAWQHMATHGGHAPGPDGLRYEDFTTNEVWAWCLAIRDTIRGGKYTLGDERVRRISKGPGRGFRELVLQSIMDRVVQRAVVEVLQPLLDPLFDTRSFGYRPRKGSLRALATVESLYQDAGLGVWVSADVKNAFPSVPVGRLLGVLRKYLPDEELLVLIEVVTRPDKLSGLRQGSPLSPLLLNIYLHHLLDRAWRQLYPDIPLLRFADDILLLCRTPEQARDAYRKLVALLRPSGFELKESVEVAVRHLSGGEEVNWMGFGIGAAADGLRYTVTENAWASLTEKFAAAHERPNSPLAAVAAIQGWIADKAPCYPTVVLDREYTRIGGLAAAEGYEEIPYRAEVGAWWSAGHARWCKLRRKVAGAAA